MGSSKSKSKPPAPPKIEAPVAPPEEVDILGQEDYMRKREQERMSVESTLMTSPIEPKETMMSSVKKKKKKPEDDQTQTMGY